MADGLDDWLTSCDDDALAEGENLALIGDELIQFGSAEQIGEGQFRLSRLLRGRGGTEWAMDSHIAGELFLLIRLSTLQPISLPGWARGSLVTVMRPSAGASATTSLIPDWRSLRPPAPVKVQGSINGVGDLQIGWTQRSRAGWAWLDDVDAPLGERSELYEVTVTGPASSTTLQASEPQLTIDASAVTTLGSGTGSVAVRQMGNWAASIATELALSLP